jgi:hypothetical protein
MPTLLSRALRSVAPALASAEDARAELLSLIWDVRFDREHALQLAAGAAGAAAALQAAADRFDGLQRRQQQRLRRLGARLPDGGATIANAPHPAD